MTTSQQWIDGARPRTLPAAVVPVTVGAAVAVFSGTPLSSASYTLRAVLALVVSVSLQVGVNYANDYSDGIRGTDEVRVGPVRLVGQGLATPGAVKRAAFLMFAVAGLTGTVLIVLTQAWWLFLIGVAAIAAAWFYTGGSKPYGYSGYGEIVVFVFFGLVAVVGTTFVLTDAFRILALILSIPVGLFACALLVINNLRDIPSDIEAGKRTLAVKLGAAATRQLYAACLFGPFAIAGIVGLGGIGFVDFFPAGALIALLPLPLAWWPWNKVNRGAVGPALVQVLVQTSALQLAFGLLLTLGVIGSTIWS